MCLTDFRGPIWPAFGGMTVQLPVHSIAQEADFTSPYMARWNALQLEAELSFEALGVTFTPAADFRMLAAAESVEQWPWCPPTSDCIGEQPVVGWSKGCSGSDCGGVPLRSCLHNTPHPIAFLPPSQSSLLTTDASGRWLKFFVEFQTEG